ncbi:hypothetical protein A3D00_01465 [Candidatus Woesebacteria bacterium RIFCSPHIGHO2_02_FULL_38_9]|uniref:Uncharacterized protein n=2 Tax=Candidatus Roizmaniibacteriota TaxID=1752723 RepID=A0A1F7JQ83_9BACT|nr:MAG: hypothetical protein A2966_02215 [Candidatus Roizmanbacteria bacterium RIFCSPLOWO2_01_FULL_41_22]OGK57757.1 MAG: hypothetical protein A3H86_02710 [Candidatus Roizmanbacteria bacterium RIFCSPLOWO2_02_FULL_41_9]OGM32111.1 MAG: hypothetical protein A3D00_01465 [Candidatus Woesebacteria bacterium RIFCSPHIGHO2_02_FULL_38_9]
MLNQDTKRKIDSARNILVSKVPDPKAQVEQITTALIYKFMDEDKKHMTGSAGQRWLNIDFVHKYNIPLPSLDVQKQLIVEAKKRAGNKQRKQAID